LFVQQRAEDRSCRIFLICLPFKCFRAFASNASEPQRRWDDELCSLRLVGRAWRGSRLGRAHSVGFESRGVRTNSSLPPWTRRFRSSVALRRRTERSQRRSSSSSSEGRVSRRRRGSRLSHPPVAMEEPGGPPPGEPSAPPPGEPSAPPPGGSLEVPDYAPAEDGKADPYGLDDLGGGVGCVAACRPVTSRPLPHHCSSQLTRRRPSRAQGRLLVCSPQRASCVCPWRLPVPRLFVLCALGWRCAASTGSADAACAAGPSSSPARPSRPRRWAGPSCAPPTPRLCSRLAIRSR